MIQFKRNILFLLLFSFAFSLSSFAQGDECILPEITNISNDGPVCEGGTVTLSASGTIEGVASSYIRMAGIGGNFGNREFDHVFEDGDRPGEVTRLSESQFNTLAAGGAAALRADYDVLLFTWASNTSLNASWSLIEAYLELGGSVFWEDDRNIGDLAPDIMGEQYDGSYGCGYVLVNPAPFPELVANGVNGCFVNHHLRVFSWPAWMQVYITGPGGTDNLAIAGIHPTGGGRMIVQGPDMDFHADEDSPPGTTGSNQYQMLLNQIDFLAAQQAGISWTGPDGFTSDEANPVITGFTAAMAGEYTATLTNETGGGCFVTATTTVELVDGATISCPGNLDVDASAGMCGANVTFTVTATNNDEPVSYSHSPGSFFGLGTTTVTASTSSEVCGDISCSFDITVTDNHPAQAVCQTTTVNLTSDGSTPLSPAMVDGGSSTTCGTFSLAISPNAVGCADKGSKMVTLTATDDSNGLSTSCNVSITVADPESYCCEGPEAICQNQTIYLNDEGEASVTAAMINNGSTADCGLMSMELSQTTFYCDETGGNTVTLTVTDINEDSDECTATVTVVDAIDPEINCPGPISVNAGDGQCGANVEFNVTATDNCDETTIVCTIGGEEEEEEEPSECATNNVDLSITFDNFPEETSWIIMNMDGITVESGGTYGDQPDGSTIDLSFDLADGEYMFVIMDSANDGICCGLFGDGSYSLSSEGVEFASGGEFGGSEKVMFCIEAPATGGGTPLTEVESGDFFPVGTTTVTCTVTDASGRTDVCTFDITVADNQAPQLNDPCPGNITLCGAQTVSWAPPTATDNCGVVETTSTHNPGDFFDVGTTTVTYTFYDAAGLSVSCSFDVTINTLPVVSIVQSDVPEWCQGVKVLTVIVTNEDALADPITFEWSSGETTDQILVTENGPYSVVVTDGNGCEGGASTTVEENLAELLSAHTIVVDDEMDMDASVVLTGGVGIQDADEVTIQNGSDITTFLVSADAVVDGSSNVNNWNASDSPLNLPDFIANPFNDTNDEMIAGVATLSGTNYGNVFVKTGATLIIDNAEVFMKSLTMQKGSSLAFNQEGILVIRNKLNIGVMCNVNVEGPGVVVYVGDNAEVGQGSTVAVDIYAPEGLDVSDSGAFMTTYMYGLFITDELNSGDNVVWGWNLVCGDFGGGDDEEPMEPSNCCIEDGHGGLGCDDAACEALICGADSFCCDTAWDGICASAAIESCEVCFGGEEPPVTSNCCDPDGHGGLGCDDAACEALICGADSFCCDTAWDGICASAAIESCEVCTGPLFAKAVGTETENIGNTIESDKVAELTVFPNPTSGEVNIGVAEYIGSTVDVQVTNAYGQKVWFQHIEVLEVSRISVDLSADRYAAGMYQLTLFVNDAVITKQIVLSK